MRTRACNLSRAPSRPDAHAGTCAPLSGRGRTSRARFARLCDCGRTGTQGGEERRTYRVRRALQAACTRALRRWRPQGEAPRRLGLGAVRPAASVRAALPAVSGGCGARFASGARVERLRSGLILATYIQHDLIGDGLAVSSRRLV